MDLTSRVTKGVQYRAHPDGHGTPVATKLYEGSLYPTLHDVPNMGSDGSDAITRYRA